MQASGASGLANTPSPTSSRARPGPFVLARCPRLFSLLGLAIKTAAAPHFLTFSTEVTWGRTESRLPEDVAILGKQMVEL